MKLSAFRHPLDLLKREIRHRWIKRMCRNTLTVDQLNRVLWRNRYLYRATYSDGQIISRHNAAFRSHPAFVESYAFANRLTKETRPDWSTYLLQWGVKQAASIPGDLVECGTARGFGAAVMVSSLDLAALGKRLYLFDSWSGLRVDQLTSNERKLYGNNLAEFNALFSGYYDEVERVWSQYPSVSLVKGFVPESLRMVDIPRVCFIHIDMNSVYPEVEALRFFWPRLSTGGIVVLDDYGQPGREEQKSGMDHLAGELQFQIFASPTGQGLIIKAAN